jgi:hypothetical protein
MSKRLEQDYMLGQTVALGFGRYDKFGADEFKEAAYHYIVKFQQAVDQSVKGNMFYSYRKLNFDERATMRELRKKLMEEEYNEFWKARHEFDQVEMFDAYVDMLYLFLGDLCIMTDFTTSMSYNSARCGTQEKVYLEDVMDKLTKVSNCIHIPFKVFLEGLLEVCRSNETKFVNGRLLLNGLGGVEYNPDKPLGKVIKPATYVPPNLSKVLKTHFKKEDAIIFDIDYVVSNPSNRTHLIYSDNKDYDAFYERVDEDTPIGDNIDVIMSSLRKSGWTLEDGTFTEDWAVAKNLVKEDGQPYVSLDENGSFLSSLEDDTTLISISDRPESCREKTYAWLFAHMFKCKLDPYYYFGVYRSRMDAEGDYTWKERVVKDLNLWYNIRMVYEANPKVIESYKSLGLSCAELPVQLSFHK